MILELKNISKSFGEKNILSSFSLTIMKGDKITLAGPNGVGKTTLLRMILGDTTHDSGSIKIGRGIRMKYMPQEIPPLEISCLDYVKEISGVKAIQKKMSTSEDGSKEFLRLKSELAGMGGFECDIQISRTLSSLGLEGKVHLKLSELSVGQRVKCHLAALIICKPDLLLLDEPTNNLDIPSIEWLQNYLISQKNLAIVIVSHDVELLDAITNKVAYIDWESREVTIVSGNYSDLLYMLNKDHENSVRNFKQQEDDLEKMQKVVNEKYKETAEGSVYRSSDNDKAHRGLKRERAGRTGKKAKAMKSQIDRMDLIDRPLKKRSVEIVVSPKDLRFSLDLSTGSVTVGSFTLQIDALQISAGKKVAILGANGAGKSTLLKTIAGVIDFSGERRAVGDTKIGNYVQSLDGFPLSVSGLEYLREYTDDMSELFYLASKYGLEKSALLQEIKLLSPGQRARLLYVRFSLEKVNVLILDEPTNHLDSESQEALMSVVNSFPGAVIITTHDRKLLRNTDFTDILHVQNGKVSRMKDLDQYLEEVKKEANRLIRRIA